MFEISWEEIKNNITLVNRFDFEYHSIHYFVQKVEANLLPSIYPVLIEQEIGFLTYDTHYYLFFPKVIGSSFIELCDKRSTLQEKTKLAKQFIFQLMHIETKLLIYYLDKRTIYYNVEFLFLNGINTNVSVHTNVKKRMHLVTSLLLDLLEDTDEFQKKHLHPNIERFISKHDTLSYDSLNSIYDDLTSFQEIIEAKSKHSDAFIKRKQKVEKIMICLFLILALSSMIIPCIYYFTSSSQEFTSIGDVILK